MCGFNLSNKFFSSVIKASNSGIIKFSSPLEALATWSSHNFFKDTGV